MSIPAATAGLAPRRAWIVSPAWDLFYIVLTPVLIVPAVLVAVRRWLSPEQVYLAVISFASIGHHLPGFMRAYGDRELFNRFKWRFLLAPPLAFGLALVFTPPPAVASAAGIPWIHLHGLEVVLTLWGTWHGLMQTYGFMRIYDLRRGEDDARTVRLDHALCVAMFVAGFVLSDHRMLSLAAALWQSGLPVFGPQALLALRVAVAGVGIAVALAYAVHLFARWRQGRPVNGVKLLLAAVTGWFFWYCGRLSTNLLVGLAMFEIFHAVQYGAIVWIYNKRLLARAGERFGPLGFLFQDRLTMLGLYLGAIAAYSAMRYFTAAPGDRMFSGDQFGAHQWIVAWFVASSLLHFYYDGFIWKVSESSTQANLVDGERDLAGADRLVPGLVHAAKWGAFAVVAGLLAWSEARGGAAGESERRLRMSEGLLALSPANWQHAVDYARELERRGETKAAATAYQHAVELAPDQPEPIERLGMLDLQQGRPQEAIRALTKAIALGADAAATRHVLGMAYLQAGDAAQAVAPLEEATRIEPDHSPSWLQLGDAYLALGNAQPACEAYERVVTLEPDGVHARIAWAESLLKRGDAAAAVTVVEQGLERQPKSAELMFTLGALFEHQGKLVEARAWFEKARQAGLHVADGAP